MTRSLATQLCTIAGLIALATAAFAPVDARAAATVEIAQRIKNRKPDKLAVALVRHFAGLDRVAPDPLVGRSLGRQKAVADADPVPPSWLGHTRRIVRQAFTPDGFAQRWGHPLAHVSPRVMAAEGGASVATTWQKLACGGRLETTLQMNALRPGKRDRFLLTLSWECGQRRIRLVVVASTQGALLEAFGITSPRFQDADPVRAANLFKGHQHLVRLPGNHVVVQVQWHPKRAVDRSSLPRLQPFGAAKPNPQRRALWLFSPKGRPLFSLFGPGETPLSRVGVSEKRDLLGKATVVTQRLARGLKRSWRIDLNGRITPLGSHR